MKILPITTHYNQRKNTNFCSSSRIVYKKQGGATYSNWTHFLRPDFSWKPFINLVKEKYKNYLYIILIAENEELVKYYSKNGFEYVDGRYVFVVQND